MAMRSDDHYRFTSAGLARIGNLIPPSGGLQMDDAFDDMLRAIDKADSRLLSATGLCNGRSRDVLSNPSA